MELISLDPFFGLLFVGLGGGWIVRLLVIYFGISPYIFEPGRHKFWWTIVVAAIPFGWIVYLIAGRHSRWMKRTAFQQNLTGQAADKR